MHAYLFVTNEIDVQSDARAIFGTKTRLIEFTIQKIADVRELIHRTNVAHAPSVYIIKSFHKASAEAQNAFLKRLEEPGENVNFILTTNKEDSILPTILSRCQIKRFGHSRDKSITDFSAFMSGSSSLRLSETAKLGKREDAVEYLNSLIDYLVKNLCEDTSLARPLKLVDETMARVQANANTTLQLTRLCVLI